MLQSILENYRSEVERVLQDQPTLSAGGFIGGCIRLTQEDRDYMVSASGLCEYYKARSWLAIQRRTKHPNEFSSSYGLKHTASRMIGEAVESAGIKNADDYMPNGIFIAAAIALGFTWQRCDYRSPNVFIGIAKKAFSHVEASPQLIAVCTYHKIRFGFPLTFDARTIAPYTWAT